MPLETQLPRPTEAELEILTVMWRLGPATVRQVYEHISQRRTAQYSTTLKFMQIMAEKGLLLRDERRGRVNGRSGNWPDICWNGRLAGRPRHC